MGGEIMKAWKTLVKIAFIAAALTVAAAQPSFADWTYSNNGYVYTVYGANLPGYPGNIRYDSAGRIASFNALDSNGNPVGTYAINYNGNVAYVNGVPMGTVAAIDNSRRAAEGITNEDQTRVTANAVASIVTGRTENILAPKGAMKKLAMAPTAPTAALGQNDNFGQLMAAAQAFNTQFGQNSGDEASKFGVWANGSVSFLGNTASGQKYNGNSYLLMVGADFRPVEQFVFGVAVGGEVTNLNTSFNDGRQTSGGWTISPYLGVAIIDNLTLDVMGSYTWLTNYSTRSNDNVWSNYNPNRWMFSAALNYYYLLENWKFGLKAGYMYSNESANSITESNGNVIGSRNTYVGQIRLGGRAGYTIGGVFEPYLGLYYVNDVQLSSSGPRSEMEGVLGFNLFATQNFSCGLEVVNSFFRQDTQNTRLSLNLRYEF
jgi:hypothetical protein